MGKRIDKTHLHPAADRDASDAVPPDSSVGGILFRALHDQDGWYVLIEPPEGGRIEVHDFSTRAGAKAWILVHARAWAHSYRAAGA